MTTKEQNIYNRIKESFLKLQKGDLSVVSELEKTLVKSQEVKFPLGELQSCAVLSLWYSYQARIEEAIHFEKKALALSIKLGLRDKEASSYNALGGYYFKEGDGKTGIEYYMKGLEIYDELKDNIMKSRIQITLGSKFVFLEDFVKGEEYLLASWNNSKNEENKSENWNILNELAQLYYKIDKKEKALEYLNKAQKNAEKFEHSIGLSFIYRTWAEIAQKEGDYEKAITHINKALKKIEETGVVVVKMRLVHIKAENLVLLERNNEAKQLLLDHMDKIKQDGKLMDAHQLLYKIYEKDENYEEAFKHHVCYIKLKDEIEDIETQKHIRTTEAKFQNQIKENEKEILRLQSIEMEQKALRAQLNPHFFFNSLNSINKFIVDNEPKSASKFLSTFSGLMRKTLENSEESFITIEEEVNYLKDYLTIEQLRLDFSFQFEINVDEKIEEDFIKIPTMMLQPYIENSIKHGINGIENGLIKVNFEYKNEDNLTCRIEDNGRGRGESSSTHKSMGTSILENRLDVLSEKNKLNFEIENIDLKNSKNENCGTKIVLTIPLIFEL